MLIKVACRRRCDSQDVLLLAGGDLSQIRYRLKYAPSSTMIHGWKHVSPLPAFITGQDSTGQVKYTLWLLAPVSYPLSPSASAFSIIQGTWSGMQEQNLAKRRKNKSWRTPRGGDGKEEKRWEEKEKCTLYFSNGWEMIRWDLLTIIRCGLINSAHSQRGEGWSPSTKEQTLGGRYPRKRWPGVSNMRQHSPPHTLHRSIWLLSELISWRIKANRRDPRACGCLRCTLPHPSSPPRNDADWQGALCWAPGLPHLSLTLSYTAVWWGYLVEITAPSY